MRYWIGTMNRVTITDDNKTMPKEDGWHEVTKEKYEETYNRIWDEACNSFWHC